MIATLSPAGSNVEESLSTLRYAQQARTIINVAKVNEDTSAKLIRGETDSHAVYWPPLTNVLIHILQYTSLCVDLPSYTSSTKHALSGPSSVVLTGVNSILRQTEHILNHQTL